MRGFFKGLSVAAMVAVVAACTVEPAPKDVFYRLTLPQPAEILASPKLPGVLEISRFDSDGVVGERALTYSSAEAPQTLQNYRYEFWAEPPGIMLQERLASYLRQARVAETIATPDLRLRPDYYLRGSIKRLEQVVGNPSLGVVELQLALTRADDGTLILLDTFKAQLPAQDASPQEAAKAMSMAVGEIYAAFLSDLAQATIPKRGR